VLHSEYNPSQEEPVHLLQIWILPERTGLRPSYEERSFSEEERRGKLRLIASRDGRDGSVTVHQDVAVSAALLEGDEPVRFEVKPGRHAWLHTATGKIRVGGEELSQGDAAAISEPGTYQIEGEGEILLFDLA
jgi:redox-sensitive bicupin YhaK (pirin superfamily)